MESLNDFFISYGYLGMALAAFLAGTFVPFSSEAVMAALLVTTSMDPVITVLAGTAGNVAGSVFNYGIGRTCSIEYICRLVRVKPRRLQTTKEYVEKKGSWLAIFSFLPVIGSAISISLGILRANFFLMCLYTIAGKLGRYIMVAYSVMALK